MSKERLQEIEVFRTSNSWEDMYKIKIEDFEWLKAEVERLQAENELNEKTLEVMDKQRIQMGESHEETFKGAKLIIEQLTLSQQKAERLEKALKEIEKAWRYGSGEDIDIVLQETFETEGKE
jgi:hypothetical protein